MSHGSNGPKDDVKTGTPEATPSRSPEHVEVLGTQTPSSVGALQAPRVSVERPELSNLDKFPLAKWHLENYPFRAPERVRECVAWYEGSFNPLHEGHAYTVQKLLNMGFRTVVVGTVPENPHKIKLGLPVLPFDLRVKSVKEHLAEMGLPLASSSKEPGVFVTETPASFHDERMRAWYRDTWFVMMGPDNFHTYYEENRAWALFAALDPEMQDFSRFRRLYETFLKDRVLVNDEKYAFHATDIRSGAVEMLPAVERNLGGLIRELHTPPSSQQSAGA